MISSRRLPEWNCSQDVRLNPKRYINVSVFGKERTRSMPCRRQILPSDYPPIVTSFIDGIPVRAQAVEGIFCR